MFDGLQSLSNTIHIEPVSNGWIVTVPNRIAITDDYKRQLIINQAKDERIFVEHAEPKESWQGQ